MGIWLLHLPTSSCMPGTRAPGPGTSQNPRVSNAALQQLSETRKTEGAGGPHVFSNSFSPTKRRPLALCWVLR